MHVDRICMELPILYFKWQQLEISKLYCIYVVKICLNFASSACCILCSRISGTNVSGKNKSKIHIFADQLLVEERSGSVGRVLDLLSKGC